MNISKSTSVDLELLFSSIDKGDLLEVKRLVGTKPDVVHAKDGKGRTPLHKVAAAFGDYVEIARFLLESGADAKAVDTDGWTPFDWADFWVNRDVVDLLVEVQ